MSNSQFLIEKSLSSSNLLKCSKRERKSSWIHGLRERGVGGWGLAGVLCYRVQ